MLFADGMATPQLVKAVVDLSRLTEEEASHASAIEADLAEHLSPKPVALEAYLLKVAITVQYAAGVLERLGLEPPAIKQFYDLYSAEHQGRFEEIFKKENSSKLLVVRMEAYDQALHAPRVGDPGREVSALFCRFLNLENEPSVVEFSHDICSDLSQVFVEELAAHSSGGKEG